MQYKLDIEEEFLRQLLYIYKKSPVAIAKMYDVDVSMVYKVMKRFGFVLTQRRRGA